MVQMACERHGNLAKCPLSLKIYLFIKTSENVLSNRKIKSWQQINAEIKCVGSQKSQGLYFKELLLY